MLIRNVQLCGAPVFITAQWTDRDVGGAGSRGRRDTVEMIIDNGRTEKRKELVCLL